MHELEASKHECEQRHVRTGNADEVRPGRSGVRAREVDVRQLLDGAREIRIRHRDEVYTLRLTRLDKLILTK